ncbi:virulence protein SciE type [Parasulfuritortus cantonensis]|uniref:Virulence protein SciE type n=1 Tax=Parasulfuritortus cantonensis TaxID=2528202 RepID=A0A4R1BRZ9_9PROT|nr:type VI secretion system accessory protein TagJ [Parasulfuritortus cantonensis]TCJ20398.1 virulence protein SciE type [Parasulfuritortus cantonensis]
MQADTIERSLKEGNLASALAAVQAAVRAEPARISHRILLFQIYSLLGQWEKAATQLATLAELDKETLAMVQTYRAALQCEALRQEVFAGTRLPLLLGDPVEWVALLIQAVRLDAEGHHAEAAGLRGQAFEAAPQSAGDVDGQAFAWLADADMRLGPVLEAILDGKYYWIPFERLSRIEIDPPEDLRDLVWLPATLTFANGGENVALLPARYPGSERAEDDALKLARRTEWREITPDTFIGLGQRMWTTDAADYPLLDVRRVTLGS